MIYCDARTRRSLFNEIHTLMPKCILLEYMRIIKVRECDAYKPVYRYGMFQQLLCEKRFMSNNVLEQTHGSHGSLETDARIFQYMIMGMIRTTSRTLAKDCTTVMLDQNISLKLYGVNTRQLTKERARDH
jgi:hypothetical protein